MTLTNRARVPDGKTEAVIICDCCGLEFVVHCNYQKAANHRSPGKLVPGSVNSRLTKHGWEVIGKRHYCSVCKEARRLNAHPQPTATQETPMPKVTDISNSASARRRGIEAVSHVSTSTLKGDIEKLAEQPVVLPNRTPTPQQRREIMDLIESVYDKEAQRYKGAETDKTLAETLEWALPGWVAEVRELFFGPLVEGNDEMVNLGEELRTALDQIMMDRKGLFDRIRGTEDAIAVMREGLPRLDEMEAQVREGIRRVEQIKKAVGPKAAHI